MSIELVMIDMGDVNSALDILLHCHSIMPKDFFLRLTLCCPKTSVPIPTYVNHLACSFSSESLFGYNVWLVREFPRWLICDHCLTIHRDGFILNPKHWTDEFLNYDYVGAPWDAQHNGGNGGFYLISKSFARWVMRHPIPIEDGIPADVYVCTVLEGTAKQSGFRYAPNLLEARFSLESQVPEYPRTLKDVFGFHGKWNLNDVGRMI